MVATHSFRSPSLASAKLLGTKFYFGALLITALRVTFVSHFNRVKFQEKVKNYKIILKKVYFKF